MGVTDFETKVAVMGPDYEDASGRRYLPMLVQPVLVYEAAAAKLRTVYERAVSRDLRGLKRHP